MGRKNKTQKRVVWSYPLWIRTPNLVRPEKALALPEHISGAASRTTGLVRKFEEYKELKKRLQNLAQSLVQVCSSCGSLANTLGTAMDSQPKPCCGFFSPEVIYIRNSNQEFTVWSSSCDKLDRTAWLHSVSTNSAGEDEGLLLRSSNGTWPQAPTHSRLHYPEFPVCAFCVAKNLTPYAEWHQIQN